MLLKDQAHLHQVLQWMMDVCERTDYFPTESDLVKKIHHVLRGGKAREWEAAERNEKSANARNTAEDGVRTLTNVEENRMSDTELYDYIHDKNGNLNIDKTNGIIDKIFRGVLSFGRLSGKEERGRTTKAAVASAMLSRGSLGVLGIQRGSEQEVSSIEPKTLNDLLKGWQTRNERDRDRKNLEDRYGELITWSKSNGFWVSGEDEIKSLTTGKEFGQTESRVYLSKDGNTIYKIMDLEPQLQEDTSLLSDYIALNNANFPDVRLDLIGFMEEDGKLYAVIAQPFIAGRVATQYFGGEEKAAEGIREALGKMGYEPEGKPDKNGMYHTYSNGRYLMTDVHGGNIIFDEDGNPHMIDVKLELKNTEDYGTYSLVPGEESVRLRGVSNSSSRNSHTVPLQARALGSSMKG